jgi:phosphate transport system protein
MTNIHLKREIERLKASICRLGTIVEETMQSVAAAAKTHDVGLAEDIVEKDVRIDKIEVEIEEECLKMLALYQPVAADLRFVASCLKMNNDLERIGDLCCNIAERIIATREQAEMKKMSEVSEMFELARDMVKDAVSAMIDVDTAVAADVIKRDDEVDERLAEVYKKTVVALQEDSPNAAPLLSNLSIARNLERIADYATNICEDVFYMADGVIVRHSNS